MCFIYSIRVATKNLDFHTRQIGMKKMLKKTFTGRADSISISKIFDSISISKRLDLVWSSAIVYEYHFHGYVSMHSLYFSFSRNPQVVTLDQVICSAPK